MIDTIAPAGTTEDLLINIPANTPIVVINRHLHHTITDALLQNNSFSISICLLIPRNHIQTMVPVVDLIFQRDLLIDNLKINKRDFRGKVQSTETDTMALSEIIADDIRDIVKYLLTAIQDTLREIS